ncbi:hypothetical protein PVK06_026810 [Gossypium arboreum]|uniref:Uncharacterized protein n=1 Tax=Gossypium arboreum TaxID=29729 RepID=A0ABR0NYQ9_GOSAR|nr:hypothetical protein PVK06_026809 [Gossypium arboreum]KAK5811474.1 hypothetical protein PVK06_026810 [Gossypium arboreum]
MSYPCPDKASQRHDKESTMSKQAVSDIAMSNRSWDEGHDMSAWYNDKVYDEGFYEEWEIEEHERLLMMELQQTPSDEAVQDVPNLDYGYSCIVVNHLELDCPKPLDINNNKASSLMNGASTTKGSYVEKYNMP